MRSRFDGTPTNGLVTAAMLVLLAMIGCQSDSSTGSSADTTPPAAVTDLRVTPTAPGTANAEWTAPGDDGREGTVARYDLRYAAAPIDEASWDSAQVIQRSWFPRPAGQPERYTLSKLPRGIWHFALRAADAAGNSSALSNDATVEVEPVLATFSVKDLAVVSTSASSVTLRWTAPGDSVTNTPAVAYDLRFALETITPESWEAATPVAGLPAPSPRGATESLTIPDLGPLTTYHFALKASNSQGNWSALSNPAAGTTSLGIYLYQRLTTSTRIGGAWGGDWSVDGQAILFTADWEVMGYSQIYTIPIGGGPAVRRTNEPVAALNARWSPDGTRFAYIAHHEGTSIYYSLMIMEATPGAPPIEVATFPPGSRPGYPSWSPDGTRLIFHLSRGFPDQVFTIYTVNAAGGSTPIRFPSAGVNGSDPVWSPDGTKVAYQSNGPPYDIWVSPADGGEAVALPGGPGRDCFPAWSPDGERIAFSSDYDIWMMSWNGENVARLTYGPEWETYPRWSPDGSTLVGGRPDNWIMDLWILRQVR